MYPDQAELNQKWLKVHFFGSIFNYLVPRILKMQKNVSKRLGCVTAHGGEEAIKHHSFFRDMKWKDLEDRKIKPPFRPKIVSHFIISILYFNYC